MKTENDPYNPSGTGRPRWALCRRCGREVLRVKIRGMLHSTEVDRPVPGFSVNAADTIVQPTRVVTLHEDTCPFRRGGSGA